jgi:hypothetical protein
MITAAQLRAARALLGIDQRRLAELSGLSVPTRFVDLTADRIRRASRLMNRSDPDRAANTLMVSLWFAAMGFGAVTLSSPPSFLMEQGWHLGNFDAAPIIWSGMMSIGAASFGANAQAAALKQ